MGLFASFISLAKNVWVTLNQTLQESLLLKGQWNCIYWFGEMLETLLFSENFKGFYLILGLSTEGMKKGNIVGLSAPKSSPLRRRLLSGPFQVLLEVCTYQDSWKGWTGRTFPPTYLIQAKHESRLQTQRRAFTHSLIPLVVTHQLSASCVYSSSECSRCKDEQDPGPWGQPRHDCHIFVIMTMKRQRKKVGRRRREVFLFPLTGDKT